MERELKDTQSPIVHVPRRYDLIILDLDLTLWDHEDASSLTPPFERRGEDSAADSSGELVTLKPHAREFLERCRREGVRVSVASWNKPEVVFPLLEALGLLEFLWRPVIEFHPDKVGMIRKIIAELGPEWRGRALFVDDRRVNVESVSREFDNVDALEFGSEVADFRQLEEIVFGGDP